MSRSKADTAKNKPLVYSLSQPSRCYHCDRKLEAGALARLVDGKNEREVLCMKCAELAHLELVPSGNTRLTRLATKYSTVCFQVMRWSTIWKCYERQGILVDPAAIAKAREEASTAPGADQP